jgi:Na+-transporting NADH:ubiquinone oxidoreductase subunit NqrB
MHRDFRFPRWTILLMLAIMFGMFVAIEKARDIQVRYSASSDLPVLPAVFVTVFALMFVIAAAAYLVVFALKRSGVHRLSNVHPWPGRK